MSELATDHSPGAKTEEPVYQVPTVLLDQGFYAIELRQGEMYDLGNVAYIPHYIFYDRATGIAVDVTSDVKEAPLLSATQPSAIIPQESIATLEAFLTGAAKPEARDGAIAQGIGYFKATEVDSALAQSLRGSLANLAAAKRQHDEAVTSFQAASADVLKVFGVEKEERA